MDDHELALRKAIVTRLKADDGIQDIVGARVYESVSANPTWPFVRYGFPAITPFRADGWAGANYALTVHGFAKGPDTGVIRALENAIRNALDDIDLTLAGNGGLLFIQFSGSQTLRDSEVPGSYHAVVEFEAATAEIIGAGTTPPPPSEASLDFSVPGNSGYLALLEDI